MNPKVKAVVIAEERSQYYAEVIDLFPKCVELVDDEEEADLYIFGDPFDVPPQLYGDRKQNKKVRSNFLNHAYNVYYYNKARSRGIPTIGFEGGAHIINVMNGGTMFQHVYGHEAEHMAFSSFGETFYDHVQSDHHQLMNPYILQEKDYKILMCSYGNCGEFYTGEEESVDFPDDFAEPEIIYFPKTKSLAIQPLPIDTSKRFDSFNKDMKELLRSFIEDRMDYHCYINP